MVDNFSIKYQSKESALYLINALKAKFKDVEVIEKEINCVVSTFDRTMIREYAK